VGYRGFVGAFATILAFSVFWFGLPHAQADGPGPMNIRITRGPGQSGSECRKGSLSVNGDRICYTLELGWRENKQGVSSIPAGTYGALLRYDHSDHWRMELTNVPGRSHIQIHIGNTPSDTQGCILVGMSEGSGCSIRDSAKAYAALKRAFYGTDEPRSTPDRTINVTVSD
jgi:hypothetical protein